MKSRYLQNSLHALYAFLHKRDITEVCDLLNDVWYMQQYNLHVTKLYNASQEFVM